MPTTNQKFGLAEIGPLLRGEVKALSGWNRVWDSQRLGWQVAVIILGSGAYGAAMGWWRAPEQALFVAIKFPLIILSVILGNSLINGMFAPLLGLDLRFRQSFSAIVMSFTITSAILGAFSPVLAFLIWNAPNLSTQNPVHITYDIILLSHVAVIGLAGVTGNLRLFQLLVELGGSRPIACRVMAAWLSGNLFLGTQLTWICRPFIGSPTLPVQFLRQDAFHGNFYETVFHAFQQIFCN